MAVSVYRWDDVGAPTLSGTAGALIGVLDYVLVTGQGWSKVYSGTNKAVYRAPTGNRMYLRVDDTGTTTARVTAFETMSGVDTGTGQFPTDGQVSAGLYWLKSANADATARNWLIATNGKMFYLWVNGASGGVVSETNACVQFFGDIASYMSSDPYGTVIMGSLTAPAASNSYATYHTAIGTPLSGLYAARDFSGIGTSRVIGKISDQILQAITRMGAAAIPYPNPAGGGLFLARERVHEGMSTSAPVLRGVLPGFWNPLHVFSSFNDFDTVTGTGELAGKTFVILRHYNSNAIALETSNTW